MILPRAVVTSLLFLLALNASARPAKPAARPVPATAAAAAPVAAPAATESPATPAKTTPLALETLRVLAWSQADGRAVIGFPDQKMEIVKTGEAVPRTSAVLTEVLPDKLVLHDRIAANKPAQLVWMSKGQGTSPALVQRFATESGSEGAVAATAVSTVVPKGDPATPARRKP